MRLPGGRPIPVILICNKIDLPRDPGLPDDFEISKIVQDHGFVPKWVKTSAKTGDGVRDAVNLMIRQVFKLSDLVDF